MPNTSFCLNSGNDCFLQLSYMHYDNQVKIYLLSVSGMEIMTPFPVPTHRRLQDTIRAVILTKEKPSFPVPVTAGGKHFIETLEWIMF